MNCRFLKLFLNMKRLQILFFLFALLLGVPAVHAQSTMTDQQIMDFYVKSKSDGRTVAQIVTQLMERGVTVERIRKIRRNYEAQQKKEVVGADDISGVSGKTVERLRKGKKVQQTPENKNFPQRDVKQKKVEGLSPYEMEEMQDQEFRDMSRELEFLMPEDSLRHVAKHKVEDKTKKVFGRDIFNNNKLTFEPEMNIATPSDYRLGPGDAVYIDVWGASQKQYTSTVSPEGVVNIEGFGPVQVSGMTVAQANAKLRSTLGARFGGSQVKLTVGQTKTITVNVMGEVKVPGTYTLSAFSTVFHALYAAGGINEIGTLRAIKVYRNSQLISTVDIYDFILNGRLRGNVRLASNDVIVVGPYECVVDITGKVKRPMRYEMKTTESVGTLIKYAGGFTGDAFENNVTLFRKSGGEKSIYSLSDFERDKFQVRDVDSVNVDSVLDRYKNLVELRGAVMRPGKFQMDGNISSVRQLLEAAGGLTEDAFANRGIIHRRKADRTLEVKEFNPGAILSRQEADEILKNEDVVFIPSRKEANEELRLSIKGEVRYPGTYNYASGTTIESLIEQAGGLTDKASIAKVDVARRFRDRKAMSSGNEVAQFYSFSVKDGFVVNGRPGFTLQPFDEVYVRTSPGYIEQKHVEVHGEVQFSGTYVITKKDYRLSDLVKAAGGQTAQAYLKGAVLERPLTNSERLKQQELKKIISMNDSTDLRKIEVGDHNNVAIYLDKALSHPGNDLWDVILRDGDRLIIPQYNNTVSVSGEVMYPTTLPYKPGASLSYYIDQCGGYSLKAKKSKTFATQMNGMVSRVRSSGDIQPGCNIVVPAKPKGGPFPWTQVVSLAMSVVTLAAIVINVIKK